MWRNVEGFQIILQYHIPAKIVDRTKKKSLYILKIIRPNNEKSQVLLA